MGSGEQGSGVEKGSVEPDLHREGTGIAAEESVMRVVEVEEVLRLPERSNGTGGGRGVFAAAAAAVTTDCSGV